jgi:hypothetical protein
MRSRLEPFVWTGLAAAFALGLGLRLAAIRESLWLDELSTLWAVESSLAELIRRVPQVMGQSPFYFSIAWASVRAFGESELALRLPSLLSSIAAAIVVAMAGASLGGRKAAAWSFVFFWLCYPAIWTSVDARPYALAMFFAGLATLGFVRACLLGQSRDRLLWIAGAAGLVWTHYIFAPFLLAFPLGYFLCTSLRLRYPIRRFVTDAAAIGLLLVPTLPQLARIVAEPHAQEWMFSPKHLGVFGQLLPFALAIVLPGRNRERDEQRRDLRRTLWIAVAAQLVALEAAAVVGLDLVSTRYASVTIVTAAILAADNLARLSRADLVGPIALFAVATGIILLATDRISGSFSGAGYQQWREAVAALRPELARTVGAPVLFRSGNAEDDLELPEPSTWPARLAPLRSPGTAAPDWNVVLLTYRWGNQHRPAYFEAMVRPRVETQRVFYLLCLRSDEPDSNGYCSNVEAWIGDEWPGRFRATSLGAFRQLSVVRFDRLHEIPGSDP